MSAESHQKRAPSSSSDAVRLVPNIVPPQAVSDRSIIDSVAGFINDVALTNTPQTDPKDHILWVKFESLADISDFTLGEDWEVEGNLPPPLLLCIGYGNGVQVWAVPANGEAIEVMSWKHGVVKVLRILPTPFLSNNSELASDLLDQFIHKRPLMALCGDCPVANQPTSQQGQQTHAVNFVSLKDGDVVKSIRFKNPIVDIIANRTSIAITFPERIAVFDARTLEDRLTVTTCYPCPGGLCPIALGDRWLAYAEKKMIPSKASAGGCFFDGVSSYTATVLNAAKTLSKGLRELGEQVAAGLTGSGSNLSSLGGSGSASSTTVNADGSQPGIVTILDIKHSIKDISPTSGTPVAVNGNDPIVAHFLAHTEAVTAMCFDPSGMLLLTADRRGHDFNIFRIHPHPSGSVLAAVHHLYVLHRGDTSAKVQDISFSFDSRWVAVSSMRGTTHVFPITPYGGQPGYRTHSAPHVVNRLSRFHRSAGLSVDGRSSSPILMAEQTAHSTASSNPRLPPFPHPTVVLPLAQLRQPSSLSSASSLTSLSSPPSTQGSKGHLHSRQRHHSGEETHSKPLRVAAVFAKARSWLLEPPGLTHETPTRLNRRPVDSLFVIAGHGALIQYDLEPRHASNIPKDKVCDESAIELDVEAKAQWVLGSRSNSHVELSPPLPFDNWLIKDRVIDNNLNLDTSHIANLKTDERDDRWLSQVEIVTHAGPHRRLWMGPQFIFKTYNTPSGSSLAHIDVESVEIGASRAARSTPMNMPLQPNTSTASRPLVPVLIESGSCSSHEQSPRLMDSFHYESTDSDVVIGPDSQLREDLADAMKDCATVPISRDSGSANDITNVLKTISYHSTSSDGASLPTNINLQTVVVSIVNPQGTVTTVTNNPMQLDESFSSENYILENCDETMFRPVVTVMSDPKQRLYDDAMNDEDVSQPIEMPSQLIVPVIDEKMLERKKKERELEIQEKARHQREAEKARIALREEEEERIKNEKERAQKKVEEKPDEVPSGAIKKGRKAQKYNKKYSEPEKKTLEKKFKEPSPPKRLPSPPVEETQNDNADNNLDKTSNEVELKEEFDDIKEEFVELKVEEKEKTEPMKVKSFMTMIKEAKADFKERKEKSPEPSKVDEVDTIVLKVPQSVKSRTTVSKEKSPSPSPSTPDVKEIELITPSVSKVVVLKEKSPSPSVSEEPIVSKKNPVPKLLELTASACKEKSKEFSLSEALEMKKKVDVKATELKSSEIIEIVKPSEPTKRGKKGKKYPSKTQEKVPLKVEEDFPALGSPPPLVPMPIEDHRVIDKEAIMKISMHETIGDDEIEIIPHENTMEIHDSPEKSEKSNSDVELIDESFLLPEKPKKKQKFIKNEDFYDVDDEMPPLEPLGSFDINFDSLSFDEAPLEKDPPAEELEEAPVDEEEEKPDMQKKMSELLKDTNMIFAMCSSLKEMKDDDDVKSIGSSQIQRSTSSSLTTNTTTATFASASSNQTGEGQDSDYKSLELEMEMESADPKLEFKVPADVKQIDDSEDVSSFEATSSETDDSSKKSNAAAPKFKREDDEELRPLLQKSITSLSSPSAAPTTNTTEANDTSTLPDINQKSSSTSNNGNKRKNKKKRR